MSKRARDMAFRHFNKGVSLIEKGLHEDALETLQQAEEQANEADSPQIQIAVLQTYADLLFAHDKKEEALNRYLAASDILEKNPNYMSLEQKANMFSNMALALENAGKKEEAREKYKISAQNYRELIKEETSSASHISNAVSTLNNMGALLAEIGRNGEALDTLEEAFNLHERATGSNEETEYQQKRATILENLLNIPLDDTSGIEEERYMELLEQYAEINANNKGSLKMSTALRNIAHMREKEGNTDAAFMKLEEALEIVSKQFDDKPDDPENKKMLIDILRDMNRLLENVEQSEKLLEMYGVILQMSRKLLVSMPDNTSYQLNVAFALNIIGNLLKDTGKVNEAIPKMEESVGIAVQVLEKEKEDSSSLQVAISFIEDMLALIGVVEDSSTKLELYSRLGHEIKEIGEENLEIGLINAGICNKTGRILAEKREYSEALVYFKKALHTYETVRHATGERSKMNDVLESMAHMQSNLGHIDEALKIYMQIVKAGSLNRKYAESIDEILIDKEKIADNTGNVDVLKKEYEKIIESRTELLGLMPDEQGKNTYRIKVLQEKIADIMVAMGQNREALQAYEQLQETDNTNTYLPKIVKLLEKIKISAGGQQSAKKLEVLEFLLSRYNKLMKTMVNNALIAGNRASIIENIAQMLSEKGETEEAGNMYTYALDAYANLSELEPESVYPLERTAAIHTRIAELAASVSDGDEAKTRYETSLETYRVLIDANPSSMEYQLDYAGVLDGMGALFLNMKMHAEAKKSYEDALKSYGEIMEAEPENKSYRANVTITLENLGYVLELMGRKEDAIWMYENARKIENGIE
jgi:tetratricopeptide (TPR) repeat protein